MYSIESYKIFPCVLLSDPQIDHVCGCSPLIVENLSQEGYIVSDSSNDIVVQSNHHTVYCSVSVWSIGHLRVTVITRYCLPMYRTLWS